LFRIKNPNRFRRKLVCKLLIGLIFLTVAMAWSQTAATGTGKFDINKVRSYSGQYDSLGNYSPVQNGQAKVSDSYPAIIIRITLYLALIIAVIFVVAWIVRKVGITGTSKIGGGGSMDILEVLPLGQNRNAVLIRVQDTVYLLGQTPNNIILLEKIEGQKAIDLIASSKGGSSIMQFKDAFNNFIGKIKKPV